MVLDDFAQPHVNRFDRVGGVDHLANFRRVVEERDDARPVAPPDPGNRRILAPTVLPDCAGFKKT